MVHSGVHYGVLARLPLFGARHFLPFLSESASAQSFHQAHGALGEASF